MAATTAAWRDRGASVLHVVVNGRVIGALALEDEVRPESTTRRRRTARARRARGHDHRRRASGRRRGRGRRWASTRCSPRCCPRTRTVRSPTSRHAVCRSRWSATASTTRPRSPAPTSASRSAPAPMSRSSRPVSCLRRATRAAFSVSSGCRRPAIARWSQNLAWGAGYNLVAIPLAAGVFAFAGVTLSPAVGAVLMSASTVVVAFNAQLLRRLDLSPGAAVAAGPFPPARSGQHAQHHDHVQRPA